MTLKLLTILIITGLMAQSNGLTRNRRSLSDPSGSLTEFTYIAAKNSDHGELSFNATDGKLAYIPSPDRQISASDWNFTKVNDFAIMTQNVTIPSLNGSYVIKASMGDVTENGKLVFTLANFTYNIKLTAIADKENKADCGGFFSKVTVAGSILGDLHFEGLSPNVEEAFKSAVVEDRNFFIPTGVERSLEFTLLVDLRWTIHQKGMFESFCRVMIASTPDNVPRPNLLNNDFYWKTNGSGGV